jgi:predicted DCC family thiol-disulfide oxidoreductase YuxK
MPFLQDTPLRPDRPVVVYDGNCTFCRRQLRRLERWTGETFERVPFQDAGTRFDPIPQREFTRSVVLIQRDGRAYSGAEAVYRALAHNKGMTGWLWCYRHLPGFARISEWGYAFVARHRGRIGRWFPWM